MIKYQDYEKDKGITDLEITDYKNFYIIIEAKRGWILPEKKQLTLYSERESLLKSKVPCKAIISMSECSEIYADKYLPFKQVNGIQILHLSWEKIYAIAEDSQKSSSISQKSILNELMQYLGGFMSMQTQESNWVYVVSLSTANPDNCKLSWIDIVKKKKLYFHPLAINGWPKEPPNYIAFRYNGKLQSIHHIEGYVITKNLHTEIPEMPDKEENCNFFVYELGCEIIPNRTVKTGKIYASGRKWAMLDTLLTSNTIAEACNISKERRK